MTNTKPATLKTVAEITGLSPSTVSLCLRDSSKVKASTREKVAAAVREVGYVPNRAGVRLRTGRTNVLALILSTDQHSIDYTRLLIQGIGGQLSGSRFHLNVIPEIDPRADPITSVRYVLENQTADGILLTHTSARDPRVRYLLDADFPFVSHGRTEFYSPHPFYDFHAERFVELAVNRMAERGRRRVMLAAINNHTTNYANIVNGFNRALAASGLDGFTQKEGRSLATAQDARALGQALHNGDPRCDSIICNDELIALSIISGLQDSGRVLGRDYDLICKQTTEILPTLYPQIDTISEHLFEAGSSLARMLLARLAGTEIPGLQTLQVPVPCWRAAPRGAIGSAAS